MQARVQVQDMSTAERRAVLSNELSNDEGARGGKVIHATHAAARSPYKSRLQQ